MVGRSTDVQQTGNEHAVSRLPDCSLLDNVVDALRQIERRSGIERTLAIGELILSRFFGGDAKSWRDRRRNKNNSVRRLAEREDCPFRRSSLNDAVAIYVAVLELPCVQTFGHVGASHVASVLKLPADQRQAVLERAERERLSVRELKRHVVLARRAKGERRGRPALNATDRAIYEIECNLRQLGSSWTRIGGSVASMEPATQRRLELVQRELLRLCAELSQQLLSVGRAVPGLRRTSVVCLRKEATCAEHYGTAHGPK